ncbi:MAG: lysylphosphatidylglycerol synthase transmembrane domain-containing protein [Gemmatimonadota bacterium]
MTTEADTGRLRVPPGAIRWGIIGFVAASLLGFATLLLVSQDLTGSLAGFRQFNLVWALPCLVFASGDWFGGGLRIWILLKPLDIRVPYMKCVAISGTTAALAYLTPAGSGGGPAHLYGMMRNNVTLGRAVASNFASVLVNLTFLSLAGIGAWFFGAASEIRHIELPVASISAASLFEWSALAIGTIAAAIVFFAFSPRLPRAILIRLFGRGRRVRKILKQLQELHGSLLIYARKGKLALLLATLAGLLHFGGRFLLGWAVLRGFGIDVGFWNIVLLHVMLQFLLYLMPTPGGAGIAEVLVSAVMSPFLPSTLLVAYTAVWRLFLAYLTVVAGGSILMVWVRRDSQRLMARSGPQET